METRNENLADLFDQDQADRANMKSWADPKIAQAVGERDRQRRGIVRRMIEQDQIKTARDCRNAAFILQHGEEAEDYGLANEMAQKGIEAGEECHDPDGEKCKWIYAATLDRYLLSIGQAQKFGTQFQRNSIGELEVCQPLDPTTTDVERAKYNVPPISQALETINKKHNKTI